MSANIQHINTMFRTIYMCLMLIIFKIFLRYANLSFNKSAYVIFFLIIILEYIFDNINFRKKRTLLNSAIYSVMINSFLFLIYWSFTKNMKLIYMIIIFPFFQIIIKEILRKLFIKNKEILIVGKEKELERVEKIISENYNKISIETCENFDDIDRVLSRKNIEEIILFQYPQENKRTEDIIRFKTQGIRIVEYLKFMEKYEGKIAIKEINNNWLIYSEGFNIFYDDIQKRLKRLFDLILAVIIIIPALPLIIIAYIVTKIEMPEVNPIYSQSRIGLGGIPFKMYKFRSMKPHSPDLSLEEKIEYITKFGNFIRKTRIDELPQLINVFKGELSFVGPRAEWDRLHKEYAVKIPYYYLRQSIKPGLTGWAQVMHTHGEGIEHSLEKFEYDLYYIKYQNIILDIIIFFKTIKTVIFGKGK